MSVAFDPPDWMTMGRLKATAFLLLLFVAVGSSGCYERSQYRDRLVREATGVTADFALVILGELRVRHSSGAPVLSESGTLDDLVSQAKGADRLAKGLTSDKSLLSPDVRYELTAGYLLKVTYRVTKEAEYSAGETITCTTQLHTDFEAGESSFDNIACSLD